MRHTQRLELKTLAMSNKRSPIIFCSVFLLRVFKENYITIQLKKVIYLIKLPKYVMNLEVNYNCEDGWSAGCCESICLCRTCLYLHCKRHIGHENNGGLPHSTVRCLDKFPFLV